MEENLRIQKETTDNLEIKKNFSEALKTKIEKAIGREASLLKKVEELQVSFSNSTEREMNIAKQLREIKHEREQGLNKENELKSKNNELQSTLTQMNKQMEELKSEIDDQKLKINGYEFMWDNNVRPDGLRNNASIISLEGRYHKVED